MKTYLVTGCAGFIGSNFVHYMLEKYEDIRLVNLDKLTYAGNLENLQDIEDDARHIFVQGDICDKALVTDLIATVRPRLRHQLCGREPCGPQHQEPRNLRREQRAGHGQPAAQCCKDAWYDAAAKTWKEGKKYLQVSTDEVYGAWAPRAISWRRPRCAPTARTLPPRPAPICLSRRSTTPTACR